MSKNKKPQINILELVPQKLLGSEYRKDGQIDILVPRFKHKFFQNLLPKRRNPYIKANLDELGTATWELIDGNKDVATIAEILNEKYNGELEQYYERVAQFLHSMHRNNFIEFR